MECRVGLYGLARCYANSKIDRTGILLTHEHIEAVGHLKKNTNLIITRPDKGNGVVLMEREA